MKLSEAIRLGAMMGPQEFGPLQSHGKCALQWALCAVGELTTQKIWQQLNRHWPWLNEQGMHSCPECRSLGSAFKTTFHLNDVHEWTRERIADWVATIEPEEVDYSAPVTIREEVAGLGPMRPSLEEVKA